MKKYLIILTVLSAVTHFSYWGHPNSVVFDEVHFGNFSSAYTTGEYFFDIHPPLGKLLISGAGYIGGYPAGSTNYATIGNVFGDPRYMWYRILPMIAGFLLPMAVFLLCLELGISPLYSFLAGLMIVFENSLLVQSRFILLDAFLLLFGFGSLLLYAYSLRAKNKTRQTRLILGAVVLSTLALSVKWTGLSFMAMIFLVEAVRVWLAPHRKEQWKILAKNVAVFVGLGFLIYFLIFLVHFALLTKTGPGDAFMTPAFQKSLVGSKFENSVETKDLNNIQKFFELNRQMYVSNATLSAGHQYGSKWYTWPFMKRPIFYWDDTAAKTGPQKAMIYLIGNPFIYWLSITAVCFLVVNLLVTMRKSEGKQGYFSRNRTELLLLSGFLANFLPFILVSRVAFLYHYEAALVIAIIVTAYLIDRHMTGAAKISMFYMIAIVALVGFLYFSPLSYGIKMNETDLMNRFWMSSWR